MMLHGIKAMSITGKHNPRVRAQTLLEFRQSPKSEVLFMSNVGIAGINLDCANIMIILVSNLSLVSISLITATLIGYPLVQAGRHTAHRQVMAKTSSQTGLCLPPHRNRYTRRIPLAAVLQQGSHARIVYGLGQRLG
jgi:hypothetical protein